MEIDATKKTLEEVLTSGRHEIPRYQRPYAWNDQNIRDFWNDILTSDDPHFLGSMVTSGSASAGYELIDGQQRLVTTLILLCALRDLYELEGEESLASGIETFIRFADRNGVDRNRLANRDIAANNRLKDTIIAKEGDREARPDFTKDSLEFRAYTLFRDLAASKISSSDNRVSALNSIRDKTLESEVVYVNVKDRRTAFTIFETLNDRGQSLTVMDLTKNLLLSYIPEGDEDSSERAWSDTLSNIESLSIIEGKSENFLYYSWNSRGAPYTTSLDPVENARLRRSVAAYIDASSDREADARALVSDLRADSEIFLALESNLSSTGSPEVWRGLDENWRRDAWEPVARAIYGTLVTKAAQPLPLLVALLRSHSPGPEKIKRQQLLDFLTQIENFQFRWSIAQKGSTATVRRLYRQAAMSVAAAGSADEYRAAMTDFSRNAEKIQVSDAAFKDGIKRLAYTRSDGRDVHKIRHLLARLEGTYASSKIDLTRAITIEHLQGTAGRSEKSNRNLWIFKVGNLALLPPEVNSRLPEEFSEKCETLSLHINDDDAVLQESLAEGAWGAEKARRRTEAICDRSVDIWPNP